MCMGTHKTEGGAQGRGGRAHAYVHKLGVQSMKLEKKWDGKEMGELKGDSGGWIWFMYIV